MESMGRTSITSNREDGRRRVPLSVPHCRPKSGTDGIWRVVAVDIIGSLIADYPPDFERSMVGRPRLHIGRTFARRACLFRGNLKSINLCQEEGRRARLPQDVTCPTCERLMEKILYRWRHGGMSPQEAEEYVLARSQRPLLEVATDIAITWGQETADEEWARLLSLLDGLNNSEPTR